MISKVTGSSNGDQILAHITLATGEEISYELFPCLANPPVHATQCLNPVTNQLNGWKFSKKVYKRGDKIRKGYVAYTDSFKIEYDDYQDEA